MEVKSIRLFFAIPCCAEPRAEHPTERSMRVMFLAFLLLYCLVSSAQVTQPADSLQGKREQAEKNDSVYKSLELGELVVTEKRVKRDAERETIFITDSMRKGTVSAAQLLRKVKGVKVDWITESVNVGLDGNVPVVINEHEVDAKHAMSMNPKRIKKVEIIRSPTGRFTGYPIVVNLVLYDDYAGWDLSLLQNADIRLLHTDTHTEATAFDYTRTIGNWNCYGTVNVSRRHWHDSAAFERSYANGYAEQSEDIDIDHPNMLSDATAGQVVVGADCKVTGQQTVSMQVRTNLQRNGNREEMDVHTADGNNTSWFHQLATDNYHTQNTAANILHKGNFKNVSLSNELTYNFYHVNEHRVYEQAGSYRSLSTTCSEKQYVRLDNGLFLKLSERWNLSVDNMLTWRKYVSREREREEADYHSSEWRERLNGSVSFRPSSKFNTRLGADFISLSNAASGKRQTQTTIDPHVRLYWAPVDFASIYASYSFSTTHPTLDQLSTTQWQTGRYMIRRGNPDLKACVMHHTYVELEVEKLFKLSYMWKNTANDFDTWLEDDGKGNIVQTLANGTYHHSYLGIEGNCKLTKNLQFWALLNYQWYTRFNSLTSKRHGHTSYVDTELAYVFAKAPVRFVAEYFLRYDDIPHLQGKQYQEEEACFLTAICSFLKGRLPVSLRVCLPTQLISKHTYTKSEIPGCKLAQYGDDRINSFSIRCNIRYSIGNGKVRKSTNSISIENEK